MNYDLRIGRRSMRIIQLYNYEIDVEPSEIPNFRDHADLRRFVVLSEVKDLYLYNTA
jgi:hypothetical protein